MAAHYRDDLLHGTDHPDTHASSNRWRHEESTAFAKHANTAPREADGRHESGNLASFLKASRVEGKGSPGSHTPIMLAGNAQHGEVEATRREQDELEQRGAVDGVRRGAAGATVRCGPLLNYRRIENETWYGSVLVVVDTQSCREDSVPELCLRVLGSREATQNGMGRGVDIENGNSNSHAEVEAHGVINGVDYSENPDPAQAPNDNTPFHGGQPNASSNSEETKIRGVKLYADTANTFWRFLLQVPMQQEEIQCVYTIPGLTFAEGGKTDRQNFFIPAITESMRIMFHSCNGFSVGTDEAAYSGACLWRDVARQHEETPFHVMLGGGDQIYNDGIRVNGPLRPWTDIGIPKKRREYLFPEKLRKDCDEYYVKNYLRWYSTEPFAAMNGKIPQVNLWDDHDIIDGFGSYVDEFMRCPVFRGIGGVAHKYYLLFQHHIAPPPSTFTTDAPQTMSTDGVGIDPRQMENTYVLENDIPDPSYIIGDSPGPYVAERSRSIYARLGARIAFFGIDARTERTRHQVNYPETYKKIFDRLRAELTAAKASPNPIQHLIILLGIPIAYPRLTWLENIFASPLMGPLKFMNKRFGFGGSFFNHFDGSVDLLDDLDDHYTAHTHKKERHYLVSQLQSLASQFSVRISILGGDVHLAAVGRFYSNPSLQIPVSKDFRYMANIISSAIVNKPPPQAVANLLARRNKIHHLDKETDETLLSFFDRNPGEDRKSSKSNTVTMPSRNWAVLTENSRTSSTSPNAPNTSTVNNTETQPPAHDLEPTAIPKDGHAPLHTGEQGAGSTHKSTKPEHHGKSADGSLDVVIRVEIDQHDPEGKTRGYGMSVPVLRYEGKVLWVDEGRKSWAGSRRSRSLRGKRSRGEVDGGMGGGVGGERGGSAG
ncbi:hypothetical protein SBOR_3157 [Sclerotinia borealis F-4128]|uniref:PhoD-like phosphatase domain-containing protein n=1 Tax=Sclerotinia borealis (strain F-4128) TaxID=1432307 RepID=W9CPL2_SCLBF|nr:hypothetical protein SBOR_3157 [Sclerotinia borealis F-4128]